MLYPDRYIVCRRFLLLVIACDIIEPECLPCCSVTMSAQPRFTKLASIGKQLYLHIISYGMYMTDFYSWLQGDVLINITVAFNYLSAWFLFDIRKTSVLMDGKFTLQTCRLLLRLADDRREKYFICNLKSRADMNHTDVIDQCGKYDNGLFQVANGQ